MNKLATAAPIPSEAPVTIAVLRSTDTMHSSVHTAISLPIRPERPACDDRTMVSVFVRRMILGFDTNVLWPALVKHRLIHSTVSPNMDAMTMQQQVPAAPPPLPASMANIEAILQHMSRPHDSSREVARV